MAIPIDPKEIKIAGKVSAFGEDSSEEGGVGVNVGDGP
jgi:hypothetical protein